MTDARAPHIAVLNVTVEVHEMLDTGECSGKIITKKELQEAGVFRQFLLSVTGYNKENCLQKLKQKIKEFNNE